MTPVLQDNILQSDLECQEKVIRNVRYLLPVPDGLVGKDDPRLYDPRVPPAGSVRNEHVSSAAQINQSKVALDDVIPAPWLGTGSHQAAPGHLVERAANKGVPGGYAVVDESGQVSSAQITTGAGSGSVSSVGLKMPSLFDVAGSPITGSGDFTVTWKDAPDNSWLGSSEMLPAFLTEQIPSHLIPPLAAAKFTSGLFALERLSGMVTDPGAVGDPVEYMGRDQQWHHFDSGLPYQPTVKEPQIVLASSDGEGNGIVTIGNNTLKNAVLFCRISDPGLVGLADPFQEIEDGAVFTVPNHFLVEAYSAKEGYNNSKIASYTVETH